MERSDITATDNKEKRWCILRHPDADLIGEILSGRRKVFDASGEVSYSYNFFIPFQDLKLRRRKAQESPEDDFKDYDAMLDERALRSDLHHFIFIHESKDNVKKLLNASWNKALSHRLYAYRDEHGDPVEVSNAEVERFKTVIKRYDFQIVNGEPTDEVREGDRVTVVSGPMAGSDGIIKEIREREGQILLTITFAMFQDKMHVAVPGIHVSDVRLKSAEAQQLIQDPVIGHFEDQLIELLCHLHGKKGSHELNKEDQRQLRFLYQYTTIQFDDPANRTTAIQGKPVMLTGMGGKNKTWDCREKLTALLDFLQAKVWTPQVGLMVNAEAWADNKVVLDNEQKEELRKQANSLLLNLQ